MFFAVSSEELGFHTVGRRKPLAALGSGMSYSCSTIALWKFCSVARVLCVAFTSHLTLYKLTAGAIFRWRKILVNTREAV